MGYASRSTRGQVKTKSLSAIRSEDRLRERKPNQPSIHSDSVKQPNTKVRCLFFPSTSCKGSTQISLCGCVQGLGCTKTPKGSGALIVVFSSVPIRMISVLTRASRSDAMACSSSSSRTLSSSTSQWWARQRCVRNVNTTKLLPRQIGTRAGGR